MNDSPSMSKLGVYVDVINLYRNGGSRMRYDVLREFACRDGAEPARLNAYVSYDRGRAADDPEYARKTLGFHSALRDIGYKVIVKDLQWYEDELGRRVPQTNTDLELAVDALEQSESLDRVLIASGDGDFVRVIQALQNRGCRVEVLGLGNASRDLQREADFFISGYLVPDLIPIGDSRQIPWGHVGSRVRGWCYWHHREESYGFLRFLRQVSSGLWIVDTRHPDSPYETAFFHDSKLPVEVIGEDLPNRDLIFDFKLIEAERNEGFQAVDINLTSGP